MAGIILSFIILATSLVMPREAKAQGRKVNLAGITIDMSFCEAYDKWSGILAAYSKVNFPITGAPGITMGTLQNTSLVVDLCSYITQQASLDTQGRIFSNAQLLNKMSGDQHTERIDFLSNVWDLASATLPLDGRKKPHALTSPMWHRRLVRTVTQGASMAGYDIPTKMEKQREMSNMARIAYERSAIKGVLQCPKPDNTDYLKKYQKEIAPIEQANVILQEYINSYERALIAMGRKILSVNEYKEYLSLLNSVVHRTSMYNPTIKTMMVDSEETREVTRPQNAKATDPRTEQVKVQIPKNYQVFGEPRVNTDYKNEFIKKFGPLWDTYIASKRWTETRGLLTSDKKSRLEDDFKEPDVICNSGKSYQKFDPKDPQYQDKVKKDQEECFKNSDKVIEDSGGLIAFYVESLVQKDRQLKVNQGKIWEFESRHLGNVVNISEQINTDAIDSYAQPEVQCASINNLGMMTKLQLEQEALNGELTQELLAQQMKQNAILEAQAREKKEAEEANERREAIIKEMQLRETYINDDLRKPDINNINF